MLTGNPRAAAEAKLKIFALDHHVDLVPIARRRAHRKLGVAFTRHSTLLIGDTPEDVIAARDGGARMIAVASGKSSLTDLKQAGPDIVLRDLADSAALLDAIRELLPPST